MTLVLPNLSDFHNKTSRTGVSPVLGGGILEPLDSRDGCPTVVWASEQARIAQFGFYTLPITFYFLRLRWAFCWVSSCTTIFFTLSFF